MSQCSPVSASAGIAASLTERLIDAAIDYERSEGRQGKEARIVLSEARAAVEAAITNAAQAASEPDVRELLQFVGWVESWVSNPVDAYSRAAIDGLFQMTRNRISALTPAQRGTP